jgi:hypothetical protein
VHPPSTSGHRQKYACRQLRERLRLEAPGPSSRRKRSACDALERSLSEIGASYGTQNLCQDGHADERSPPLRTVVHMCGAVTSSACSSGMPLVHPGSPVTVLVARWPSGDERDRSPLGGHMARAADRADSLSARCTAKPRTFYWCQRCCLPLQSSWDAAYEVTGTARDCSPSDHLDLQASTGTSAPSLSLIAPR